ncbi:MAG: choice-of-anchor Q domain-containing protein, partial [Microcoleaceae cyanobacterium]
DVEGDFISNGNNIIGNSTGSTGFENDIIEPDINKIIDPTLADNGGQTLTHRLVFGSPAIDGGENNDIPFGITTDQRGLNRIIDGNGDMVAIVDIGAFELQQPPPSKSVPEPSSVFGLLSLVIIAMSSLFRRKH